MSKKSDDLLLFNHKNKKWYLKCDFSSHLKIFHRINNQAAEFAPLYIHSFNFFKIKRLNQSERMNIEYYKIEDKPIGDKIRFYRLKKGLLQKETAVMIGIDRSTYIKIENNKTVVSLEILDKLSKILKIDVYELMDNYHNFIYCRQREDLKKFRNKRNITQKQLADMLKIGIYMIKRWESGKSIMSKIYYEILFK